MQAKIEVIGGSQDGTEILISQNALIGRDLKCDVVIQFDRYVSKHHATLKYSKQEYFLEDLNSTNGTFVDEDPVRKRIILTNGQIFRVGQTNLRLSYE